MKAAVPSIGRGDQGLRVSYEHRFRSDLLGYVPRLRAFARALAGDYARGEDLAQEAVMSAWRARDSFTPGSNMEAWLFRILRNQHVSGVRRSKRKPEENLDAVSWRLAAPDDPSAAVSLNDLRQALNRLAPRQREALVLVGAGGWSYEEAARFADCPLGTMKSRVFRARRVLAACIQTGAVLRDAVPASAAMNMIQALVTDAEARTIR